MTVNGPLLAQFLEEMIAEEEVLLQQQRDHEAQSLREALLGKRVEHLPEKVEMEAEQPPVIVDLTRIPRYEEYRCYRLDSQEECEEFYGALRYLLERVPLMCDLDDLLSHWHWFAEWSIGCVGICDLKDNLSTLKDKMSIG